jgi:cellulose biosynthesis protein BcsQ
MITIFSSKGGVGKTTIAYALASIYDIPYYTNDYSVVLDILEDTTYKENLSIKDIKNGIVDLGGFITSNTLEILENSDVIIVPVTNDLNALKKTDFLIKELKDLQSKIILVASNIKDKDYKEIRKSLKTKNLRVCKVMNSTVFKRALKKGISISEAIGESPLLKHAYSKVQFQLQELIEEIESI